ERLNGYCKGVKFHGVYEHSPINNPAYAPALEILNDREALLLVHCGRFREGMRESDTSYLHALDIARAYPRIKVTLGHMGGGDSTVIRRCIADSKDSPNVYYETSGITTPFMLEWALKHVPADRILFGSDAPWCSFRSRYYNVEDAN